MNITYRSTVGSAPDVKRGKVETHCITDIALGTILFGAYNDGRHLVAGLGCSIHQNLRVGGGEG
jgi:hypothetical protein